MLQGLGRTQQDLLSALLYQPAGMSIDELAHALTITRTAVRQHLASLERDGLVARGQTRPTGRRPEQLHQLTDRGKELFPRHYHLLANLVIGEVAKLLGHDGLLTLMRTLGSKMAADLEQQAIEEERIVDHMNNAGYEANVFFRSGGEKEIVAHNCVFHHLAAAHPEVCELDLALIGSLGHGTVEHLECMVRGANVCRFHLKPLPTTPKDDSTTG
ncbi:transcriptional regulator [Pseudomonas laurentiana]|uniref:Helix-turn-helix domain-containing protein n=1 Tax=Pseudomonas laurentiana TaxID=2364649 RepID=A0A6I5RR70_9PSED|nr:MarR family transcriptional regulator [Pseudomonas laurentiana]NES10644.1 helix-turn-helix domain-containing protein [Pseudomonas laurentiana]GGU81712.1 transcriptional regulator [Pseudomonas laurentiana]